MRSFIERGQLLSLGPRWTRQFIQVAVMAVYGTTQILNLMLGMVDAFQSHVMPASHIRRRSEVQWVRCTTSLGYTLVDDLVTERRH